MADGARLQMEKGVVVADYARLQKKEEVVAIDARLQMEEEVVGTTAGCKMRRRLQKRKMDKHKKYRQGHHNHVLQPFIFTTLDNFKRTIFITCGANLEEA